MGQTFNAASIDIAVTNPSGLGIITRDALQSLQSNFSGAVAPASPVAYQLWADTSTGLMKVRDAANAAWVVVGSIVKPFLGLLHNSDFKKLDANSPVFNKTAANVLTIKAGTMLAVAGTMLYWDIDTVITMPALVIGTDYAIYACTDGTVRADANWVAPVGYTTANSRKIGGFHYGLVPANTTVASGGFNAGAYWISYQMVWKQSDVAAIAGINKYSIWDLRWRPVCPDPRGMALVSGRLWVDIYLCNSDVDLNGTSKYNSDIASGTVLPKVPAEIGGDGVVRFIGLTYSEANILAEAKGKRLPNHKELSVAAYGVLEGFNIPLIESTYPVTTRTVGYTSKYGIEQAYGHIWCVVSDGIYTVAGAGRGSSTINFSYGYALPFVDSYLALLYLKPWNIGLRCCSDHIITL